MCLLTYVLPRVFTQMLSPRSPAFIGRRTSEPLSAPSDHSAARPTFDMGVSVAAKPAGGALGKDGPLVKKGSYLKSYKNPRFAQERKDSTKFLHADNPGLGYARQVRHGTENMLAPAPRNSTSEEEARLAASLDKLDKEMGRKGHRAYRATDIEVCHLNSLSSL